MTFVGSSKLACHHARLKYVQAATVIIAGLLLESYF